MPSKRGGATHRTDMDPAQLAEETIRCYQLKLAGKTYDQIAEATGLSVGTAHARVQARITETVLPLADEVRKVELDRLDRWLAKLDVEIEAGNDLAKNIATAVRVSERRCRLMGADAPVRVEAAVTQVTQADLEFAELIREAKAASAVKEAELRGQV